MVEENKTAVSWSRKLRSLLQPREQSRAQTRSGKRPQCFKALLFPSSSKAVSPTGSIPSPKRTKCSNTRAYGVHFSFKPPYSPHQCLLIFLLLFNSPQFSLFLTTYSSFSCLSLLPRSPDPPW